MAATLNQPRTNTARRRQDGAEPLPHVPGPAVEHGGDHQEGDRHGRKRHHGAAGEQGAHRDREEQDRETDAPQNGRGIGGGIGQGGRGADHVGGAILG